MIPGDRVTIDMPMSSKLGTVVSAHETAQGNILVNVFWDSGYRSRTYAKKLIVIPHKEETNA